MGEMMPGCPIRVYNQTACEANAVVTLVAAQFGHQNANGHIDPIEPIQKNTQIRCNQDDGIDSARPNANVGAVAIIIKINYNGRDFLRTERINTDVPGKPIPGVNIFIVARLEFAFGRDETDAERALQTVFIDIQTRAEISGR
jgi:hypothetical protein